MVTGREEPGGPVHNGNDELLRGIFRRESKSQGFVASSLEGKEVSFDIVHLSHFFGRGVGHT